MSRRPSPPRPGPALCTPLLAALALSLPACANPSDPGVAGANKKPGVGKPGKPEAGPDTAPNSAAGADSPAQAAPTPTAATDDTPALDPIEAPPTGPHPFDARDLLAMHRLGGFTVSPDGNTAVFVRRVLDRKRHRNESSLWSIPTAGGTPKRLSPPATGDTLASDGSPHITPDGKTLVFVSRRGGSAQVWRSDLDGSNPTQVTDLPLSIGNLKLSPDGTTIAYSLDVFVDCDTIACTKDRLDAQARTGVSARAYEQMFVRHWDTWKDGRRSHLFTQPLAGGDPVDVTRGQDADIPSRPFGGPEEYTFSPDGKTIVYAARDVGEKEPWSTNFDLFAVATDGSGERKNLTEQNPAWDTHPVFSPDGKTLAWTAMARPGYESDRFVIKTMGWPDGETRTITESWDRSARSLTFAPDGASLWVTAQHVGQVGLFNVTLADGSVRERWADGTIGGTTVAGDRLIVSRHDLSNPADLWTLAPGEGEPTALTQLNTDRLNGVALGDAQQWSFSGAGGDTVYAYAVKPANFEEGKRYPLAFLIHGGPQGSFGNKFHYRWNPQTYAGAGYAVVMIDFHGSTGYGQDFTDSIGGDWGGKPLVDLQKGLAEAKKRFDWIDTDNACALGASYGGFMINWIAGQWPDGFACLVNHDGVFDQRSMYYATEELWFPEWEHGGPYYANAKGFEKHNPVRFVDRWKTPMMVIHGSLDYRVPETQGLGAFTALQRQGIESRYVLFPDENHWVLSPANSLRWHQEVGGWLDRWLRP